MPKRLDKPALYIDLDAVAQNYRTLKSLVGRPDVAGVVKADAYGLGMAPVVRALWNAGCRRFFVAFIEGGIALRRELPEAEICVLHGVVEGIEDEMVEHCLTPVLNHKGQLALWRAQAHMLGKALPAIIHIDTGMNRLGFAMRAFEALESADLEGMDLRALMSHLACSDQPDHPMNRTQLERVTALRRRMPGVPFSFANSGGVLLGKDYHQDGVRCGAALYGIQLARGFASGLKHVATLKAPILQLREIDSDGTVGYGATYQTGRGRRIAVLPAGYADGIDRHLSNHWEVVLHHRGGSVKVPIAGRVSMDLLSVDVSGIDAPLEGAWCELIGPQMTVDEVGKSAGTSGYEIMTRLGARYVRHYMNAAASRPAEGKPATDGPPSAGHVRLGTTSGARHDA